MNGSILIIVPARGGTKRLPGKNIKFLGGKSLLGWTAECLSKAKLLEHAIISSDDDQILQEAARLRLRIPFVRPTHLALDSTSSFDVVSHSLHWYRDQNGYFPEFTMLLQPTSPFRSSQNIEDAINLLSSRPDCNSVLSVKKLDVKSKFVFKCCKNSGVLDPIMPDNSSAAFVPNGAIYLARTEALFEQMSLFPAPILPKIMSEIESLDIDTGEDWQIAQSLVLL
ncbi:acylneuraminate cytidylyltransferase family protein [Paracoccaceae bacterium]|nr:acylneuraminate cytidylyltransferase family protein [Paracoccaceae bacterium]